MGVPAERLRSRFGRIRFGRPRRGTAFVVEAFSREDRSSRLQLSEAYCTRGGFTLHSDPWRPLEDLVGVRFGKRSLDIEHLYRWLIPKRAKPTLLRELSGLGVSHRNVFPELDGIARSLWETEALWNPDRQRPNSGLQPTAPRKRMR